MSESPYRGIRVLVLGASGFIGRWVARALAEAGADLRLVVRDAAAATPILERWGVRAPLAWFDLTDDRWSDWFLAEVQPAIVFNLAGYGVNPAEREEAAAQALNARLPASLADAMARHHDERWPGQHIVHVGSALEYGTTGGNLSEDGPAKPTTLYGRTKLAGTTGLRDAAHHAKLRATTARLFTVYGPGEPAYRLLPTLLAARPADESIPLTAGTQRRDFTYVEDVADGLLRLGAHAGDGGVVNLATGTLATVRTFVETAAEVLGIVPARLGFGALPTRPEEQQHDPVTVAKLRGTVGWAPETTIANGVRRTARFVDATR